MRVPVWVVLLIFAGVGCSWIFVVRSTPYRTAVAWTENSSEVRSNVGAIRHIYPDLRRYRVGSSGALSRAHFAVFVQGAAETERVDFVVLKVDGKWSVAEASGEGRQFTVK
jgi:hypothetical protein